MSDFFDRLDQATDYEALVRHLYGDCRSDGSGELWLVSPLDGTPADKFSINAIDGRWQDHHAGNGGSFISLVKQTHAGSWKDEWAAAIPGAKEILFPDRPASQGSPTSSSVRRRTFAERARIGRIRQNPDDMKEFVDAWGVSSDYLIGKGLFTQKGGRLGSAVRMVFPVHDPKTGEITGLKMRALTACIPTQTGKKIKSKNMAGLKAGLIGFDANSTLPVLILEGEKDWVVAAHDLKEEFHVITNSNGAGSWKSEWGRTLQERDVILCYDEDEAGNRGSRRAATMLYSDVRSVCIAHLGTTDKDVFDWLREEDGPGLDTFKEILRRATPYDPKANPGETDTYIRTNCMADDLEPAAVADTLFRCLDEGGATYNQVDEREGFCAWRGRVYPVVQTDPWWQRLVYEYTGRDAGSSEGRRVHQHLTMRAITSGMAVASTTWFARRKDCLYLPLYGHEQRLVEIAPQSVTIVPNGYQEVVLMPLPQVKELTYLDDDHYDPVEGEKAWVDLFNLINCEEKWRKFVSAVVLALPFFDWCETHPLLRFQGPTGSGKSFASKIITTFLYGQAENQGGDTLAALYRMAGSRMLLSLDNLEDSNLRRSPDLKDLMLRAASGTTRAKSARESERDVIAQRVTCWIVSTGKSPIGVGHEDMEERLVIIPTGGNQQDGFYGTGVIKWIEANRNLLFSYFIRHVQDSLAAILAGKHLDILRQLPPSHRPRLQEWYSLLAIAAGDRDHPSDTTLYWLESAYEGERSSIVESDPLIPLITRLPSFFEDSYLCKGFREHEPVDNGAVWEITLHAQTLHVIFSRIAREAGLRYGVPSSKSLGYRIRSLKRRSEEFGFAFEQRDTQTRVPGVGQRGKAWFIRVHKDAITALVGSRQHEIERFVGLDSGKEITITPEEIEQAREEHENSSSCGDDTDWTSAGDPVQD